jgi:hypothetical protein
MNGIHLTGLNGANSLAYLSALGVLRLLSNSCPEVRLSWTRSGQWTPVITGGMNLDENSLPERLVELFSAPLDLFELLGKNITVPKEVFQSFAKKSLANSSHARSAADFASAFGCEACEQEKLDRIQYTSFCFITGSGHQNFLETVKTLRAVVGAAHLKETVFQQWTYPNKGQSFRWDPSEAREYALRWNDPGPEGVWSQWGANWLAFEALPLFPTYPVGDKLETTGFLYSKPYLEFTWPIWETPLSCDSVRSLVGLKELCQEPSREFLAATGITEVYRAQRVRIGSGANFKVSFRPPRSL